MGEAPDNKRRAARLEHELPVAYRSVGSFLTDWATNISQGGLFINTRAPLPVGTRVKILIQLPTIESPVALGGTVARVVDPSAGKGVVAGMGIQFTDVDPSRREQLEALVARLQRDLSG